MKFIAAAVQMVSGTDWRENLRHAEALVEQAASRQADLVVLPEYFCLMGQQEQDKVALAEAPGSGPLQQALASMAKRHRVWLVGGTVPLVSPGLSSSRKPAPAILSAPWPRTGLRWWRPAPFSMARC